MQPDTPIETIEEQPSSQHKTKKSILRARNGRFISKSGSSNQSSPKKKKTKILNLENGVFYASVIVDQLKEDKEALLDEIHKKDLDIQHCEWQLSKMGDQIEKLKEQCHNAKKGMGFAIIFALSCLTLLVAQLATNMSSDRANQQAPIEVR